MRDKKFDIQRTLLLVFVMIAHIIGHFNIIHVVTNPAFIIIGGYFAKIKEEDTYISVVKKHFYSVLVYYFIFQMVSMLFYVGYNDGDNMKYFLTAVFNGNIIGETELNKLVQVNFPLWFLTYYFVLMSLYDIEYILAKKIARRLNMERIFNVVLLLIVVITFALGYFYICILKKDPKLFHIDLAFISLPFVYFGNIVLKKILNKVHEVKEKIGKIKFEIALLIVFLVTTLILFLTADIAYVDMVQRDFENIFMFVFLAIFGYVPIYIFSYFVEKVVYLRDILAYIGERSIYVLAYHMPSQTVFSNIMLIVPGTIMHYVIEGGTNSLFIVGILFMFAFSMFMYALHKGVKRIITK